jgi:hypothetical protein
MPIADLDKNRGKRAICEQCRTVLHVPMDYMLPQIPADAAITVAERVPIKELPGWLENHRLFNRILATGNWLLEYTVWTYCAGCLRTIPFDVVDYIVLGHPNIKGEDRLAVNERARQEAAGLTQGHCAHCNSPDLLVIVAPPPAFLKQSQKKTPERKIYGSVVPVGSVRVVPIEWNGTDHFVKRVWNIWQDASRIGGAMTILTVNSQDNSLLYVMLMKAGVSPKQLIQFESSATVEEVRQRAGELNPDAPYVLVLQHRLLDVLKAADFHIWPRSVSGMSIVVAPTIAAMKRDAYSEMEEKDWRRVVSLMNDWLPNELPKVVFYFGKDVAEQKE